MSVEVSIKVCEKCGKENAASEEICVHCGHLLGETQIATRALGDTDYEEGIPRWGSARYGNTLLLQIPETNERFHFQLNPDDELILGRADPDTGEKPEVDLTTASGLEKGVSRRHAIILRRDGALHIMDNNSANGTFLNGQRLVAQQPRILRDGDDIRLGHLVVRVTFQNDAPQNS